jgi:hypothetical protein
MLIGSETVLLTLSDVPICDFTILYISQKLQPVHRLDNQWLLLE